MSQGSPRCPQCDSLVEPNDTICLNCYFELSQEAGPVPTREPTRQQTPAQPSPMHPDTRPDIPPGGGYGSSDGPNADYPQPAADEPYVPEGVPEAHVTNVSALADRPTPPADADADTSMRFRPKLRPPMAVVTVLDDDGEDGESHRVRIREITFGRKEGEIVIPHDRMMSGRHAQLVCRNIEGAYRWHLRDLDSTNGTFVRVKSSRLEHNSMVIIGAFRYRFNAAPQGVDIPGNDGEEEAPEVTMGWKKVSPEDLMAMSPSLIRITHDGEGDEYKLPSTDQLVGTGGKANLAIADDPMLGPAHVRIYQDEYRRWKIEDLGSTNGTWISISEKRLDMTAQFQLGEQRFKIRFP